jgi:hemerythrin superfamily protein
VNAIEMLKQQHREVDELFEEFEGAGDGARKTKERICQRIADALAIHAQIEEQIFYPESKEATDEVEDLLRESVEEHLSVKRLLAEIMESSLEDPQIDAKLSVLKEQVQHHVHEEEKELFPKVKKACSAEQLEDMGTRMERMAEQLEQEGEPSRSIPDQTDEPAHI